MGITCFCGTYDDIVWHIIQGNGKNISGAYDSLTRYLQDQKIYNNFKMVFGEFLPTQDLFEMALSGEIENSLINVDEMSLYLNSLGESKEQLEFIMRVVKQLRKMNNDLNWYDQRFNDVHKRLRIHTRTVYEPVKYHTDRTLCMHEKCMRQDHIVLVYEKRPFNLPVPIVKLNPQILGQLYNTREVFLDSIKITKDKLQDIMKKRMEKQKA